MRRAQIAQRKAVTVNDGLFKSALIPERKTAEQAAVVFKQPEILYAQAVRA